jgi:hypothetical protein
MNNSDHNDFINWQNGDEEPPKNFFYYGPFNDKFKDMWEKMHNKINKQDYVDDMKEYMNFDDLMNDVTKNSKKRPSRNKSAKTVFDQDDYLKLIEIRGYLSITEQYAHVKALDKLINQIVIIPKDKQ